MLGLRHGSAHGLGSGRLPAAKDLAHHDRASRRRCAQPPIPVVHLLRGEGVDGGAKFIGRHRPDPDERHQSGEAARRALVASLASTTVEEVSSRSRSAVTGAFRKMPLPVRTSWLGRNGGPRRKK
jgi:hypothetical protein